MKIVITNFEEAGMPQSVADHCQILLERRIQKEFPDGLPEEGSEVTILYSEKDPLGESQEPDDQAYFIYFVVDRILTPEENNSEFATVELSLIF